MEEFPTLSSEVQQFVSARLGAHRAALGELGAELARLVGADESPHTVRVATDALRSYVGDRALVEASALMNSGGEGAAAFRSGLVHRLALAAVGSVVDAGKPPAGRPQDALPQSALQVFERAYALVSS